MATPHRNIKKISNITYKKSCRKVAKYAIAILCTFEALTGCQSSGIKTSAPGKIKKEEISFKSLEVLNLPAPAAQPSISKTGDRLFFITWGLAKTKNPQVFEYDFVQKKQTRWTFTDGQTFRPFLTDAGVVYSNDSEESKEFMNPKSFLTGEVNSTKMEDWLIDGPLQHSEVYKRPLPAASVERQTKRNGIDLAWPTTDGQTTLFTEVEETQTRLFFNKVRGTATSSLPIGRNLKPSFAYLTSPQVLYYSQYKDDQAIITKVERPKMKVTEIFKRAGRILFITMDQKNENEIWMAANFVDPKNWDIYNLRISDGCLSRITTDPDWDIDPSITGNSLYFASKRDGVLRIYKAEMEMTNRTCL